MMRKPAWYLVGLLIIGLALLAVSCSSTPPAEEEEVVTEEEEVVTEEEEEVVGEEEEEAGSIPLIPADHAGRTGCPICHEDGIAGAPQWPDDHDGRTEATCSACHQATG